MTINTTLINNITTLGGLANASNNFSDGILISGGIIVLYIITIMVMLKYEQPLENSLAISSWSFFIIATLFWFGNLVSIKIPLVFLLLSAFSVLYLYASRQ